MVKRRWGGMLTWFKNKMNSGISSGKEHRARPIFGKKQPGENKKHVMAHSETIMPVKSLAWAKNGSKYSPFMPKIALPGNLLYTQSTRMGVRTPQSNLGQGVKNAVHKKLTRVLKRPKCLIWSSEGLWGTAEVFPLCSLLLIALIILTV